MFTFTPLNPLDMKGCNMVLLDQTESTNKYAMELLERQALPEWTLVVARQQTAGRGVDGSTWESEPDKNLTFSMVFYPNYISVEFQFYLNKAISLGVYDLIREMAGEQARIKWPNDIYFNNGKIAGILIQNGIQGSRFSYCVAGIGLNVNQQVFRDSGPNPVSLKMITGKEFDLDPLLDDLCSRIRDRLGMLQSGRQEELDQDYLSALYRLREMSRYSYKGQEITARITGISRLGHLVLEIPSQKIIECDLKEIKFII